MHYFLSKENSTDHRRNRRFGKCDCQSISSAGAQVAVCGTRPEKAAPIEELAKSLDRPFLSLSCDLTDAESTNQMLNSIEHTFAL